MAADQAQNVAEGDKVPERALQTEEEMLLYLRVLKRHGTTETLISRLQSPVFGALKQLSEGKKTPFLMALVELKEAQEWETLYMLCRDALGKGPEGDAIHLLAADWAVWRALIQSAAKQDVPKE